MKNWIVALIILVVPVIAYYALDKNSQNKVAFEAQAQVGKPSVIKFYSTMCLDCKKLDVVTKEVMPNYADKLNYQAYNVQNNDKAVDALVQKYGVNLVPTMLFIKESGEVVKKTEGYLTNKQLEQNLNALLK